MQQAQRPARALSKTRRTSLALPSFDSIAIPSLKTQIAERARRRRERESPPVGEFTDAHTPMPAGTPRGSRGSGRSREAARAGGDRHAEAVLAGAEDAAAESGGPPLAAHSAEPPSRRVVAYASPAPRACAAAAVVRVRPPSFAAGADAAVRVATVVGAAVASAHASAATASTASSSACEPTPTARADDDDAARRRWARPRAADRTAGIAACAQCGSLRGGRGDCGSEGGGVAHRRRLRVRQKMVHPVKEGLPRCLL